MSSQCYTLPKMTKTIKICMLTSDPFPLKGGAGILTYELSQALSRKGHEVTVVCRKSGDKEVNYIQNIKTYHILPSWGKIRFLIKIFTFYRFLKNNKFDIIHAHFVTPTGTMGLVGKLFGIPILVTAHGYDIQKDKNIGYGDRLNKISAIIIWFTLKIIDFLVVVSKAMIEDGIEAGCPASKIGVVYNGINLRKIPSLGGIDTLQRYKITKDNFIVLYLGRLHPKKCPDDLVKAFPEVVKKPSCTKPLLTVSIRLGSMPSSISTLLIASDTAMILSTD